MSSDERTRRAEARRRRRLAARGELPESQEPDAEPEVTERRGGILDRLFPPAPPLPNRPDPLTGYSGDGPLSPITKRIFLLRSNLLAWVVPGAISSIGLYASITYVNNPIGLFGTFLLFGGLIAAGWFGWQRPSLFGVAAAILGFAIATAIVLLSFSAQGATPETFAASAVILNLLIQALYQSALGFLGGWYGGYLRRRQTQLSGQQAARPRKR